MKRNISNIEYINLEDGCTLHRFIIAYQKTFLSLRIFLNTFIDIFFRRPIQDII